MEQREDGRPKSKSICPGAGKLLLTWLMAAAFLVGCQKEEEVMQETVESVENGSAQSADTSAEEETDGIEEESDESETEVQTEAVSTKGQSSEETEFQKPEGYSDLKVYLYGYAASFPPKWGNMSADTSAVYVSDDYRNEAWMLAFAYDTDTMEMETDLMKLPDYFSGTILKQIDEDTSIDTSADLNFKVEHSETVEINGREMLYAEGTFDISINEETVPCAYHAYYLLYSNEEATYYDTESQQLVPTKDIPVYFMAAQRQDTCREEVFEALDTVMTTFRDI